MFRRSFALCISGGMVDPRSRLGRLMQDPEKVQASFMGEQVHVPTLEEEAKWDPVGSRNIKPSYSTEDEYPDGDVPILNRSRGTQQQQQPKKKEEKSWAQMKRRTGMSPFGNKSQRELPKGAIPLEGGVFVTEGYTPQPAPKGDAAEELRMNRLNGSMSGVPEKPLRGNRPIEHPHVNPAHKDEHGNEFYSGTQRPVDLAAAKKAKLLEEQQQAARAAAAYEEARAMEEAAAAAAGQQKPPNAPANPTGRASVSDDPRAAEERQKQSIFEARNAIYRLKKEGKDMDLLKLYEARLDLVGMLSSTPRDRDNIEAVRLGEETWQMIDPKHGKLKLPAEYNRTRVYLCRCISSAYLRLGQHSNSASWQSRANAEVLTAEPVLNTKLDNRGYRPPQQLKDEATGRMMAKRKSGAFTFDANGNEQRLFHLDHPMFQTAKKWKAAEFEDGPMYTQ